MKTQDQIELEPDLAARQNFTVRSAVAAATTATQNIDAIRPFRVQVPETELTELRNRINATKWPERETVSDASQGVQLTTIQALARYWATDYDWRTIACFRALASIGKIGVNSAISTPRASPFPLP